MDVKIEQQFKEFEKTGITLKMLEGVMAQVPEITFGPELSRLQIINGEVYGRNGYATHPSLSCSLLRESLSSF